MNIMDIFEGEAFKATKLTQKVNREQFVPNYIQSLGWFNEEGVDTTTITIEETDDKLAILPTAPRGGRGVQGNREKRKWRQLSGVHIPAEDKIHSHEIQDRLSYNMGPALALMKIQELVDQRTSQLRKDFDVTHEHMMMGCLKGSIVDADGTTVLMDMYAEFERTKEPPATWDFTNTDQGALREQVAKTQRRMANKLGAKNYNYIYNWMGPEAYDRFVKGKEVRPSFDRWQDGEFYRDMRMRRPFWWGGAYWDEYRGQVGNYKFLDDLDVLSIPVGVPGLFETRYTPGTSIDMVNQTGLPLYVQILRDPSGANDFVTIKMQRNLIMYCTRPELIETGTAV